MKKKEIAENTTHQIVWTVSVYFQNSTFQQARVSNLMFGEILLSPNQGSLLSLTKLPCPMIMDFSVKLKSNSIPPFPRYIDIRLIDDLQIIRAVDVHSLFQLITVILLPAHLRNLMNTLNCFGK